MRLFCVLSVALTVSMWADTATAKQYVRQVQGREVVVHTNPLPVVLHRMVPPQHGRHVTERELHRGRIPQSGRYGRIGR